MPLWWYEGSRGEILEGIQGSSYDNERIRKWCRRTAAEPWNREYKERLVQKVMARRLPVLPAAACPSRSYGSPLHPVSAEGNPLSAQGKLEVEALDATGHCRVSEKDFDTAGSVMFLLGIGSFWKNGPTKSQ